MDTSINCFSIFKKQKGVSSLMCAVRDGTTYTAFQTAPIKLYNISIRHILSDNFVPRFQHTRDFQNTQISDDDDLTISVRSPSAAQNMLKIKNRIFFRIVHQEYKRRAAQRRLFRIYFNLVLKFFKTRFFLCALVRRKIHCSFYAFRQLRFFHRV